MTAESQPVSYVVLAKEVREAKTRLGLDRDAAADVALELARRTVRAALAATSSGLVLVVTSDPTIALDATGLGAEVAWEGRPLGINRAAALGRDRVLAECPLGPIAILVADLPRLRPEELDRAAEEFRRRQRPVFVADHTGEGTTLLMHGPDSRPSIGFGRSSALMHTRLGYEPVRASVCGLRADLDTPQDLADDVVRRADRPQHELGEGPCSMVSLRIRPTRTPSVR